LLKIVGPRMLCTLLFLSMFALAYSIKGVEAQSTTTTETTIFSHAIFVPPRGVRAPYNDLAGGTIVRITFNASEAIDFFCQNSWEYNESSSSGWHNVTSHWSDKTAFMNKTYTTPTTDVWYFTLVNYENHGIDVYDISLYRIETYEIHVETDKEYYGKWGQATLKATVNKDGKPALGIGVSLQVSGPSGNVVFSQNNQTNAYGRAVAIFDLSGEVGTYAVTARAVIVEETIEDSATFSTDVRPPTTSSDYDGTWHTANFTITLTAVDNESGVSEIDYRINNGPIQNVSANGQPFITVEGDSNTIEYWSTDKAGNEESHHLLSGIQLDKTAATGSIVMNNGETYTNSSQVELALTANDNTSSIYEVRYSNDGVWDTEPWEPPSTTRMWSLALGDGLKTVYYQIENQAGLVSITYSDSITLDTESPIIGTASRMPNGDVQPDQEVRVSVNVADSLSGVKGVRMRYNANASVFWVDFLMAFNSGAGLYEYIVPGYQTDTVVEYEIIAYDFAGNSRTENIGGQYYIYTVVPEFSTMLVFPLLVLATFLIARMHEKAKFRRDPARVC